MTTTGALRPALTTTATSVVAALALAAAAAPAQAAAPSFEREAISFQFQSTVLTQQCGVPVTVTGEGSAINRTFEDTGRQGLRFVRTVNVAITYSSGDRSTTARDVGGDVERLTPDGSLVLSVIGQLPGDFKGVLKIDLDTGEVLQEPTRLDDRSKICRALTG